MTCKSCINKYFADNCPSLHQSLLSCKYCRICRGWKPACTKMNHEQHETADTACGQHSASLMMNACPGRVTKAMQAKQLKSHLMTSLASADRQLASMAADKPTATACCAIFPMMRLGSRETGTSRVSAKQREQFGLKAKCSWQAKYSQRTNSSALTLVCSPVSSPVWEQVSLYRPLRMPTPIVPGNTDFSCTGRW